MNPWIVVTGAPSSGKTTLVNSLAARGFPIIPEVSRRVIESRGGYDPEDDGLADAILEESMLAENNVSPTTKLVLDRALPDTVAFRRLLGVPVPYELDVDRLRDRYALVFALGSLPFVRDAARNESDENRQEEILFFIVEAYRDAGYRPIYVPAASPAERLRLVLERIQRTQL